MEAVVLLEGGGRGLAPQAFRLKKPSAPSPKCLLFPQDVTHHHHQVPFLAGGVLHQVLKHGLGGKASLLEGGQRGVGQEMDLGDELFQAEFCREFNNLIDHEGPQAFPLVFLGDDDADVPRWRFQPTLRMCRVASPTMRP